MFPLQDSNQPRVPLWNLKTLEIMSCWPQMNIANWLVLSAILTTWSGSTTGSAGDYSGSNNNNKKVVIRASWGKTHTPKKEGSSSTSTSWRGRCSASNGSRNKLCWQWTVTRTRERFSGGRGGGWRTTASDWQPTQVSFPAAGVSRARCS